MLYKVCCLNSIFPSALHGMHSDLNDKIKEFYDKYLTPKLFKYELLK